LKLDSSYIS